MSTERAKRTVKPPKKFDELEGGSQATTAWLCEHGLQRLSCHVPAYYGCPGVIVAQQRYCKGCLSMFLLHRNPLWGSPIMGKHIRILHFVLLEEPLVCFACTLLPDCVRSVHRITSDLTMLGLLARTVRQHSNFYMATFSRPLWGCLCNHMCTKHSIAGLYVANCTTCWDLRAKPFAHSIFSRRWPRGGE